METNMDDKFTQEECLALINGIKDYEWVYNPAHQFYKSKVRREMAWDDICSMVGKPAVLCKKKWRHLRDHYIRGHIKRGNTIENWCYYKPLNFLEIVRVKKFPKNHERNQTWLSAIGMSLETFLKIKYRAVCSNHFLPEDFRIAGKSLLKQSAVPSQKLFKERNQDETNESPSEKTTEEKIEEEDDVFSETDDVQPKRLRTEEDNEITYNFESSNDMEEFVPDNNSTTETINIENDDDIDAFMNEIAQRIKQLPESLKDVAKVNILAYVTELELQQNGE